jgi:transposase
MISIGIDLHVNNSMITAIDGETGEFHKGERIPNRNDALLGYFSRFEGRPMKAVVEATCNTFALVGLLRQVSGLEICVVNPRKMRIIADSVCKNDRIDSETLAEFGLCNLKLPQSFIPGDDAHNLRSLLRLRAGMVNMRTNLKLRVKSLINAEGFFEPPDDLFGKTGREWLRQVELCPQARSRLECLLMAMVSFDERLKEIEKSLKKEYATLPLWEEDLKLLLTMPGIGLLTGLTILSELGDWRRFTSPSAVCNYAGLTPRLDSSNKKCVHGGITKQGPRYLRWLLVEAAGAAVRRVPRYKNLYEKIARKGEHGKSIAQVAIARKMLEDGWIMLRKREPFKFQISCGPRGRA